VKTYNICDYACFSNLLNIYQTEECFERKVYIEMKYPFYTRYTLSVSLTIIEANEYGVGTRSGSYFIKKPSISSPVSPWKLI
jgi:hypothetical protein